MVFAGILGQDKAVRQLKRALATGRLAHAYLFSGPEGVGKSTTAHAMAAVLFCESTVAEEPCGKCGGCIKFASKNHPDFIHIQPDGATIKINQVRNLTKALFFPPFEAQQRVVVLEDVHTMRREAGNSLLKTLEEPPPDNLLILIAADSDPVLPTIVSRCQVIAFNPLPLELAADVIGQVEQGLEREGAMALAGLTGGCPGQAGNFEAGGALALRRKIVDALLAGSAYSEDVRTETALELAGEMSGLPEGFESLLDLLRIFFKETMVARLQGENSDSTEAELVEATGPARERWNFDQLSDMMQAVDFAERALQRNCNRGLVCEVLLLKLFTDS